METPCPISEVEVFDMIKDIIDPEHPMTLEDLKVVSLGDVSVDHDAGIVTVYYTPTVSSCSMATIIGLCVKVRLQRSLPPRLASAVLCKPGCHTDELSLNKQINDKERASAALENPGILAVVSKCLPQS
jgi:metal-sulfur cluster biosynthetic enzyme